MSRRWRWQVVLRRLGLGSVLFMAGIAGFIAWAAGGGLEPGERSGEIRRLPLVVSPPQSRPRSAVQRVTVMTWNIAFARGTNPDNNANEPSSRGVLKERLRQMGALVRKHQVDILLLQEVDFDARRSHHLDQLALLGKHAGLPYAASALSWRARWVPHPPWPPSKHYGPVVSGGGVLSRFPIESNRVLLHPKPPENSFIYNLFYLHRYSQFLTIRLGKRELQVVNNHLEAFSKHNRMAQARVLARRLTMGKGSTLRLMGGDLNTAPPEAQKKHAFIDSPRDDYRGDETLSLLRGIPGLREIVPLARYQEKERKFFTFPTMAPTRRLDYIFYDEGLKLTQTTFLQTQAYSDHRPILAVFELP
ncbi:MAG: endonuclease/exonuclease/phosphatase family protein [Deltaproteobacteria bacterium]|nr:endonuclease/exonuclease/phosphatase family protein [Deltaproteobacteria bacterium]